MLNASLGAYTGQRKLLADGGKQALDETQNIWNKVQAFQGFVLQRQECSVALAALLPKFSGPITNTPFLPWSFALRKAGFFDFTLDTWTLRATNAATSDLHNCAVRVRFSNDSRTSVLQYYFVPTWTKGETRTAQYTQSDYPQSILTDVSRVEVTIWCAEQSAAPVVIKKPLFGWPSD